jgi:hypothetical protein
MRKRLILVACSATLAVLWLNKPSEPAPAPVAAGSVRSPERTASAQVLPSVPLQAPEAVAEFREWSGRFLSAAGAGGRPLMEEGMKLAKEHTKEIARMIKSDPQAAIAHAVPMVIRQDLPPEIVALLEERPRLRGDYLVSAMLPLAGQEGEVSPYARKVMGKDGRTWKAHVYGRRAWQRTMTNISINGVAVEGDMAVSDSPVRVLEAGERPVADEREVVEVCPVSGEKTEVEKTETGGLPPVSEETPAYETPEQVVYICRGGHISEVVDQALAAEEEAYWKSQGVKVNAGTGSGAPHGPVGSIPGGWATGNRTFLYMRCTFPDSPVDPQNEQECHNMLKDANDYIVRTSYGRCYLTYAVPPLIVLPYPMAWYNRYDQEDGSGDFLIQSHARQIARSMGYDYLSYNLDAVRWAGGPGSYGGAAYVGARGMWMKSSSVGTFLHELGHNLGLWHANFWRTVPPSVTGPGFNLEYGNIFDLMGSSGSVGPYTAGTRGILSWMPQEQFWNVTTSGTYRIHQTDANTADPSFRYALRVKRDAEREYWAEFRQTHTSNPGLMNGLMLTWDRWGLSGIGGSGGSPGNGSNGGAHLLDMTPGSFGNGVTDTRNDSALWVGRTYSDPDFNIHITPLVKNTSTTPPSMDVQVQIGDVPGNNAPTLSLSASSTSAATGASITLTATAADSDGDTLAYAWVFGDGSYSTDNSAVQTKSWSAAGHYRVLCTASDMKGRRITRGLTITVGSPSTFTVAGTVTGPSGQPLEGVYVGSHAPSNNTSHPNIGAFRGAWTDSDGNYLIAGLAAGAYDITPNLYPYVFSPVSGSVTVGPSATGRNFVGSSLPTLTISYPDTTANEGTTPGSAVVRLTRTGSTSAALSVQIYNANTGTATRNTDYALSPSPTNLGTASEYVIPAGAAFLDITLTPINDAVSEGVEYAALDFVNTTAGYVMAGTARAWVSILDDESSLPVVRLTPVDDVGHEAGTDTLTFKLERNGPTTAALNVNLTYSGTALRDADYTAATTATLPAGSASVTFVVTPLDDALIETTETIVATLASNAAYLRDGTAQSVTAVLNDNDMPVVEIATTDAAASETGPDQGMFTITRTGSLEAPLTVDYAVGGRAVLGTDYRRLDGRAVIPEGSSMITVEIVPLDDTLSEGLQDVVLSLRTSQNYVIGTSSSGTVTIADNDAAQVYVELNTATGVEPGSGSTSGPAFQISRPASGAALTVNYSVSGTATPGSDFTTLPGSITFAASDTSRTVTVSMLSDGLSENAESVTLTLLPGTGYSLMPGQNSSMTGWIFDNGLESVDVSAADTTSTLTTQMVESSSAGADFLISRRTSGSSPLTVLYTMSGTATSVADYTPLSGSAVIPAGSSSVRVTVVPVNDTTPEGVETIVMTVTPVSGSYGVRFASATMNLADNDAFASGSVGFVSGAGSVLEDAGTVNIPVAITGTPPGGSSVRYRVNGGTAVGNGVDFTLDAGTLVFAPGETSKNISVAVRHDVLPEPAETLVISLFNAAGANLGTSNHTLTIDNVSMPEAFSDPATAVTSSSMTFQGRVMPGGLATTYWFEYGGTTSYGQTTPVQNLPAGAALTPVSAAVSGLTLTSYHFRLVAQNSLGISRGIDQFPGVISTPPVIITHPQNTVVDIGEMAEMSILASGGGLSYQWQKDSGAGMQDIEDATASTLVFPAATLLDAASYRCIVTNTDGTATSGPATLTVVTPPVITLDPVSQTAEDDDSVTFTVAASGLFLNYQWQKNGEDLNGRTEAVLTLTPVTTLDDGSYRCVVSNTAGSDISAPATLEVDGAPGIIQHPQNIAVNLGAMATFSVTASGPGLSYQWQRNTGAGMENIPEATGPSHVIAAASDSGENSDVGSYLCRVSNVHGEVLTNPATLTVVSPPVLVSPLTASSVAVNEGQTFTTSVNVQGLFLTYQWRRDGLNIPDATSPTLTIPNLTESFNGDYTCRVANAAGEVVTPAVTLLVVTPPMVVDHPTDILVNQGDPATLSVTVSGPLLTYQWWHNGLPVSGATGSSYTIPSMSLTTLGRYYCRASNSAGTVTSRFALAGIIGMPIITQPPYPVLAEAGSLVRMEIVADGSDLSYAWKLNGKPAGTGSVLAVWPYTAKNGGVYVAEVKNSLRTTTSGPTEVKTVADMNPALDLTPLKWSTSGPAFWRPTGAALSKDGKDAMMVGNISDGFFSRLTTRVSGPVVLRWWQKVSTQAGQDFLIVKMNGVEVGRASGELDWQQNSLTVGAGTHELEFAYVKDASGRAGSDSVWLDMFTQDPVFAIPDVASRRLLPSGSGVTLNVSHTGIATPGTYQWRLNGKPIKGAIGSQLVLTNLQGPQAGTYDCVLSSTVNGLSMSRTGPPHVIAIVDARDSLTVAQAPGKANFKAVAYGQNLRYQWRKGAIELTDENKQVLELSFLQYFNSGDYICDVLDVDDNKVSAGTNVLKVYDKGPRITHTGDLAPAIISGPYSFQVAYDPDVRRAPVSFKAVGLPKGLVIHKTTGEISGVPDVWSTTPFKVVITATNGIESHSVETRIFVRSLQGKDGTFISLIPRHPTLNQGLGGRIDVVVSSTGTHSGTLVLGTTKYSFKGRIQTALKPVTFEVEPEADSAFSIARGKETPLQVSITVNDAGSLAGEVKLGGSNQVFTGWRAAWSKSQPADSLAGTGSPVGLYNFELDLAPAHGGEANVPQGTGFGSFTLDRNTGAAVLAGKLADNASFTSSTLAGAQGQLLLYSSLYSASAPGSLAGVLDIQEAVEADDNGLGGTVTWWRPAFATAAKERLYPSGFTDLVTLQADGGRYLAPVAGHLALGLTAIGSDKISLTFLGGGIGSPPPPPDLAKMTLLTSGKASAVGENKRGTSLTITAGKGTFTGSFTLEDLDPLDLRPPDKAAKLKRSVSWQGLLLRHSVDGWKGTGFFILPELPDAAGEKLTTTPVHSGEVKVLPLPPE